MPARPTAKQQSKQLPAQKSPKRKSSIRLVDLVTMAVCILFIIGVINGVFFSPISYRAREGAIRAICLSQLRYLGRVEIMYRDTSSQKTLLDLLTNSEKVEKFLPVAAPKPDSAKETVGEYMIKYPEYNYLPFALLYNNGKGIIDDKRTFICSSNPNYKHASSSIGDFTSENTSYYCNPYMTATSPAKTIFIWDKPGAHDNKTVTVLYKDNSAKQYEFPNNFFGRDKFAQDFSQSILERKNRALVDSVLDGEADLSGFAD